MIKQLPKNILKDFNEKDKNFQNFQNNEQKVPNINTITYGSNKDLFYYYDFELINVEIFDYLFNFINLQNNNNNIINSFQELDLDKPEKVECLIDKKYILIKFLNPLVKNKFLLEIGNLNSEKIFEPEYFLLYDKITYLHEHINNVIEAGGFALFCELFKTLPMNVLDIIGDNNIKYGIVIKKNMNNYNENNSNFEQDFTNEQLQCFQRMNSSTIKPNQDNQQSNLINNQWNNQFFNNYDKILLKNIFLCPPRVGLNNIGASCYMNAILQCLCQIEEIVIYFKYDNHVNEIKDNYNEKYLTPSFKTLIEKIWPKEAEKIEYRKRNYSPIEFKNTIAQMNPLFMNNQAINLKSFIDFIIRTLHEELNAGIEFGNINSISTYLNNNNTQFDYIFQVFNDAFQRTFRSKIVELFYAICHTTNQCLNCKNCQYNFYAYNLLEFHLEAVKNFTIENNNNNNSNNLMIYNNNNFWNNVHMNNNMMMNSFNNFNNNMFNNNTDNTNEIQRNKNNNFGNNINNMTFGKNNMGFSMVNNINMNNNFGLLVNNINVNNQNLINNNKVDISDCFDYIQKIETFKDGNKMLCPNCGLMAKMEHSKHLTTAPKILIILLNRGIGNQFKIRLEFSTELDLTKYISQKTGNIKYKLIGVITHLGESGEGGHFIAHCLSPIDNKWYTYNDSFVSETENFQKNIIDFGMPYLLFYKKIE